MVLLLALVGAACTAESSQVESQFHHAPTITTDQASYTPAQSIVVSWTETPGNVDDWIAIVTAGSPANSGFVTWIYTNGQQAGTTTFQPIGPGNYEARSYVGGTYQMLASTPFTVTGGPPPPPTATVTTDQTYYSRNEQIMVSWQGTPGNVDDWIALVPAGSPPSSGFIAWTYTNGQANGSTTFAGLPNTGDYEARAYRSGSYTILGSANFTVSSVTPAQTMYPINTPVTVSWDMMPSTPTDSYVSINTAGSPANSGFVEFFIINGQRTGSHMFSGLPAGNYEARGYVGGTYTIIDSVPFTVAGNPPPPPSLTTDQLSYMVNQPVTVSWTTMPGRQEDWVAIVPAGSPPSSGFIEYHFVNGQANGSQMFAGLPAGNYEARYYDEGTYNIVATAMFSVAGGMGGTCTPPSNPPVVGSVTSGELTLTPTDVAVTVPLSAPLASSILFTSTREREPSPNFGGVNCELQAGDATTMTPAGVTCNRNGMGTDSGSGTIVVRYTVVTFTSGVTVQRGLANTGFTNPSSITLTAVNPAQSFVLLNGIAVGGTGWGNNEFARAALLNGTTLEVRTATAGSRVAWQVVEMTGASVQRGSVSLASANTSMAATINAAPSGSIVFASYTTDNASGIAASAMSLSARLADPTSVLFERQAGGSNLDVSYEVVSLPFATISGTTTFAAGETSRTETAAGINASTSVAMTASQAILGQATGTTSYAGSLLDLVGEAAATFATGAGTVTIQRASSDASATFPWTVIDFAHNCNGQ